MAGLAATRLFAAAGSGGIALTVWALRRAGLDRRTVAAQMVTFVTVLYGVYMAALVIFGVGLRTGLLPGGGSFAITIVPAIFGGVVIALFLALTLIPGDVESRLSAWRARRGPHRRGRRVLAWLLTLPALAGGGVRGALAVVRSRDPLALGAVAWWAFDIATLWASFKAFGASPAISVVVMAYFVGMFANVLPLPGGIGGVEGGMIGALIAFGVNGPVAVVAVLVYRAFAFWLPTVPGAIAYVQLRRRVAGWAHGAEPAGRGRVPPARERERPAARWTRSLTALATEDPMLVLLPNCECCDCDLPNGSPRSPDLHLRVHLLRSLCGGALRRALSELRRRSRSASDAPGRLAPAPPRRDGPLHQVAPAMPRARAAMSTKRACALAVHALL